MFQHWNWQYVSKSQTFDQRLRKDSDKPHAPTAKGYETLPTRHGFHFRVLTLQATPCPSHIILEPFVNEMQNHFDEKIYNFATLYLFQELAKSFSWDDSCLNPTAVFAAIDEKWSNLLSYSQIVFNESKMSSLLNDS